MSVNTSSTASAQGAQNEAWRHTVQKERSHSESPQRIQNLNLTNCNPNDLHSLSTADIYSWKLKKGNDGVIFAVYCIHVSLKSGVKWLVEKRYTQFRELRKEIKRVWPDLAQLEFPKKRYMFNLSRSSLKSRQALLNAYLAQLMEVRPQPLEVAIFLEVEINIGGLQLGGGSLSQRRAASGVDSIEALVALRNRKLSFPAALDGLGGDSGGAVGLDDFHLIKVLGKGSFGKVFLVRPLLAPQDSVYAMKVLRKAEVIKRHQVEHTMTERSILANTTHPFILTLRYAFQTEQKLYMVTDYCPGGELFFHLKKLRRFTEGMMRFYSAEIALALAHLHTNKVVYRDLKPENVLLDKNGHIKLTDFGLSKRVTSFALGTMEASTATFCGTPEYLSPEMIVHRRSGTGYAKEVDWWALGIVCFELLTGWPPFYDRDFTKMCEKILYKPLVFPVKKYNITREAEEVIKGLLCRDFTKRMYFEPDMPSSSSSNSANTNANPSSTTTATAGSGSKQKPNKYNVRTHAFYRDMDFALLLRKQVIPPFVPPMGRDVCDTRNFEKEFTKLAVKDSPPSSVADKAILNKSAATAAQQAATTSGSGAATVKSSDSRTAAASASVSTDNNQNEAVASSKEANNEPAELFGGFSYNGNVKPGGGSVLDPPESPSRTGNPYAGSPLVSGLGTPPRADPGYGLSSRDTAAKVLPDLGLQSSNGEVSTLNSPARIRNAAAASTSTTVGRSTSPKKA